jgi:hypothetical protein
MVRPIKAPTMTEGSFGGDKTQEFEHDAYGVISMTTSTGGDTTLFGSDINHSQRISIQISRARLTRNLSNDWIHRDSMPMVEIHLSHSQFAEFITGNGRYEGTPCTLAYAPERGTKTCEMPAIEKLESKAETYRKEIQDSAKEQMAKITAQIAKFGEMLEAGTVSKKELKAMQFNMKCVADNMPSNMSFVVKQAEEALEKAVTHAKIEVESMIEHNINKLGREAAKTLGLVKDDVKVIENNVE